MVKQQSNVFSIVEGGFTVCSYGFHGGDHLATILLPFTFMIMFLDSIQSPLNCHSWLVIFYNMLMGKNMLMGQKPISINFVEMKT